jgi:tRNA(Ile)-lysidine synthase
MATTLQDFWLANPQHWFSKGEARAETDRIVYDRFRTYDWTKEQALGQVLYLDQCMRHFSRLEPMEESYIVECRWLAVRIVEAMSIDTLRACTDTELVWFLMPWKHLEMWDPLFVLVDTWLAGRSLAMFPALHRFFVDTYPKAYTAEAVAKQVVRSSGVHPYDPLRVCAAHPLAYDADDWAQGPIPDSARGLCEALQGIDNVAVSLSGGVDSMLMSLLLCRMRRNVVAIHIVYGNRDESDEETHVLQTFCTRIGLPLYVYRIEWLKRNMVDRAFYERMTRDLRFHVYKAVGFSVLLGHIQDDVVENIWTNLAHGNHLDYLPKFRPRGVEDGVVILRPWLRVSKQDVYKVAEDMGLPYLQNTTPSWSNRGKFREQFHGALREQYGEAVDAKIVEVADRLAGQSSLLDQLLFAPIRDSWNKDTRRIRVTQAVALGLDGHSWQRILRDVAHLHLGVGMPSAQSCDDLAGRIRRGVTHGQTVRMSKHISVRVFREGTDVWFHILPNVD